MMKWSSIHLPGAEVLLPQRRGDLCLPCGCDILFLLAPQLACGSHVTRSQEAAVWTNDSGQIGGCDEEQVIQRLVMPSWITIRVQITPAERHNVSRRKALKQSVRLPKLRWGLPENDSTGRVKPPLVFKLTWPWGITCQQEGSHFPPHQLAVVL